MKIRVTQGYGYIPSHAEVLLRQIGATILKTDNDGTEVEAEASEQQVQLFQVRGGAHRVERLPEPDLALKAFQPGVPAR